MSNQLPDPSSKDDLERNAFNAAFYDLGLRWRWDRNVYGELLGRGTSPTERIRHYLESHQSHLLRAYDASFLVDAILGKWAEYLKQDDGLSGGAPRPFEWAHTLDCQVGA